MVRRLDLGGAVTCDAYHMTDPRVDGKGVSSCIELALEDSRIERDQVTTLQNLSLKPPFPQGGRMAATLYVVGLFRTRSLASASIQA